MDAIRVAIATCNVPHATCHAMRLPVGEWVGGWLAGRVGWLAGGLVGWLVGWVSCMY